MFEGLRSAVRDLGGEVRAVEKGIKGLEQGLEGHSQLLEALEKHARVTRAMVTRMDRTLPQIKRMWNT